MKQPFKILIISIALLTLCSLTQCGKSKISGSATDITHISQWQWVSSVGGFSGHDRQTPETNRYDIVLNFNTDSTYTITKIDSSGTYTQAYMYDIKYELIGLWNENDSGYVLYINNFRNSKFELKGNTLGLTDICYDCFGHTYMRIEE